MKCAGGGAWRELGARVFGCEVRSLAALRIALGLLLLAGLACRLPEFHAHYTDAGAWPIAAAREDAPWSWSLYFLNGSAIYTATLFGISALAALALILGWHTRLAALVSWVLLISLQNRNALILNGGDVLLRLLLFWGLFLPLGARWSLDARRKGASHGVLVSVAAGALLLQVALVYFFNALFKTGPAWQVTFTAIEDSLKLETYATAWGHALLSMPDFLRLSTRAVWWLELLGPFLPFIPWKNAAFRTAAVALFMGFHLALFCCLRIGLFPLVGMAAWLPFLPSGFWDRLAGMKQSETRIAATRWWWQLSAAAALVLVLGWNIAGIRKVELPHWIRQAGLAVHLDQKWMLFAPGPLATEGWHVAVLECADGLEYDAFTGAEVDWERPASLADRVWSVNWRKFLAEIRGTGHPKGARWLGNWFVHEWEHTHPGAKVNRVRLHYLMEWTARRDAPLEHRLVYENPPGPLTEEARKLGQKVAEPGETGDN